MKQVAGKHVYLLANLYNPATYEWAWLNSYKKCDSSRDTGLLHFLHLLHYTK